MNNNFKTLDEFMETELFKNFNEQARLLIVDLFKKIKRTGKVNCKVDIRGAYDFVLVPIELIDAGRAYKGMTGKNIITVFCKKRRDEIAIETDYKKRKNYVNTDDINDELMKVICKRYDQTINKLHKELELV